MNKQRHNGASGGNGGSGSGGREDEGFDFLNLRDVDVATLAVAVAGVLAIAGAFLLAIKVGRLRWTWAFAGLPIAALVWAIDNAVAATIAVGCSIGGAAGCWWDYEDRQRGGQEAQRIRERLGFFGWAWSLYAVAAAKRVRINKGRLAIGHTNQRRVVTVPYGAREGKRGFIVGAPGCGKTVDIESLAAVHIADGVAVVCIDPKGDRSLEEELRGLAGTHGREFAIWKPRGKFFYNPLARGGATEVADKLLAGEEWTEPHYLRQAQRYLGAVLRAMEAAGEWPPTLTDLVGNFDKDRAEQLGERAGGDVMVRTREYVDSLSQRTEHELAGVRDRIAVLAESELGPLLEPARGHRELDLERTLRSGGIAYFRLDSDRFPLAAQMLGTAIVSDLVNLTGQLQGGPLRGLVIVDEFAAVAADHISRLLSRSRSSGLSVVVATQTFADLDQARPGDSTESLRRQVLATVDYVIAHRQSEPEAAETLAAMAGTRASWVTTRQVRSPFEAPLKPRPTEGSRTPEREFVRHPDEFKRLGVGEAIVIEPGRGNAARTRIWRRRWGDG